MTMAKIEIWVMDHRDADNQVEGSIIHLRKLVPPIDARGYADFRAHMGVWADHCVSNDPPDIVGFFGYRKYLWTPEWFDIAVGGPGSSNRHAPEWLAASPQVFDKYREFLTTWDGAGIEKELVLCDILQASPYYLEQNTIDDFSNSGSANDSAALLEVMMKYGLYEGAPHKIYPYILITRWSVFDRMMREIEPMRLELHDRCKGLDTDNRAYKARVMNYVMERVYPAWLIKSGLIFKELPWLHRGACY